MGRISLGLGLASLAFVATLLVFAPISRNMLAMAQQPTAVPGEEPAPTEPPAEEPADPAPTSVPDEEPAPTEEPVEEPPSPLPTEEPAEEPADAQAEETAEERDTEEDPAPEPTAGAVTATLPPTSTQTITDLIAIGDREVLSTTSIFEQAEKGLVVNLSSSQPDRVAMAVQFAHSVVVSQSIPVLLYLNGDAATLIAESALPPEGDDALDLQGRLMEFSQDGGFMAVCAFCLRLLEDGELQNAIDPKMVELIVVDSSELLQNIIMADGVQVIGY